MTINYKKEYRETVLLAFPVIIGQLTNLLMNLTDNIVVGNLSTKALSAASLANACFYLIAVYGMGAMNAVPSLIAAARGAQNEMAIRQNLRAGLYSGLLQGIVVMLLLLLLAQALPYLNQPEEDVTAGQPFLIIMAWSAPFMIGAMAIKGFFDGMEKTKWGMIISAGGLALNLILNVGLVFGKFGFPEWGLLGSAYATLISRVVSLIAYVIILLKNPFLNRYLSIQKFDYQYFIKNLTLGVPMGLQIFFEVAAFSGAGIMIGWFGGETAQVSRSAHQIVLNMASATYMIMLGFSVAGSVRVGEAFGRQDLTAVRAAATASLRVGLGVVATTAILLIIFRYNFTAMYGIHEQNVIDIVSRLAIIAAVFQFFDGLQCISAGVLRGIQDVKIPTLITFVAYWVIWIPVAYLLAFNMELGVDGIWYGDVIALAFAGVCLCWRFYYLLGQIKFDER